MATGTSNNLRRRVETQYNQATVAFNQRECVLCFDEFKEGDRITLLACKHIFHIECETIRIDKCPFDQSDTTEREEHIIPTGMPVSTFITQLSTLDLNRAAVEYNAFVESHAQDIEQLFHDNDLGTAYLSVEFSHPEQLESHPRFPAVLRKANEFFLRRRIEAYNQANCLTRPFYAYLETFGLEGNRFRELCENPDYSNPQVNQMRRQYTNMRSLVRKAGAVSAAAFLCFCGSILLK